LAKSGGGTIGRKRKWTTSAPVLTALRSLQDIPRLSTKTSHKGRRLNHCANNAFLVCHSADENFRGPCDSAFTMTAHPLDPKWPIREAEVAERLAGRITDDERLRGSALSDYPPLHADVARGLTLLFGIGTEALPEWDAVSRCGSSPPCREPCRSPQAIGSVRTAPASHHTVIPIRYCRSKGQCGDDEGRG
jgi:hypothetical protein